MNQYLALPLTAALLLLCSCAPVRLQGSGNVVSETRDVSGFERVEVCCGMHLVLIQGDQDQLTLEGEDNILREIETFVRGETLIVRYRSTTLFPLRFFDLLRTNRPVMVYLQMVNVRGVDISGGGTLETEGIANERITLNFSGGSTSAIGELEAEDVGVNASGGSEVEIDLIAVDSLDIDLSGGGRVTIGAGTVTEQQVTVSGGGHYLASGVEGQSANLEVSGGSVAEVWVMESLDVEASGGSHVEYLGNPSIDQELSGGSEVNRGSR